MKRIILSTIFVFASYLTTLGQYLDDGFISKELAGKFNSDSARAYAMAFSGKMEEVRKQDPRTIQELKDLVGFDPAGLATLEDFYKRSLTDKSCKLSSGFLSDVIELKGRAGTDYENAGQIREAIRKISQRPDLNNSEATTLVLLDISLQEIVRQFSSDFSGNVTEQPGSLSQRMAGPFKSYENVNPIDYYSIRLPQWIRCGLFVIGSGIMGTMTGAQTGAQIGTFVGGAGGAAVGAVIGGLIGGVTGLIGGALAGCD